MSFHWRRIVNAHPPLTATVALAFVLSGAAAEPPNTVMEQDRSSTTISVVLRIPLEHEKLVWSLLEPQKFLAGRLVLSVHARGKDQSYTVFERGRFADGWGFSLESQSRGRQNPVISGPVIIPRSTDASFSLALTCVEAIWARTLMMGGFLPAGEYASELQLLSVPSEGEDGKTSPRFLKAKETWPMVITKLYVKPARRDVMSRAGAIALKDYEYLLLSSDTTMQTRLFRVSEELVDSVATEPSAEDHGSRIDAVIQNLRGQGILAEVERDAAFRRPGRWALRVHASLGQFKTLTDIHDPASTNILFGFWNSVGSTSVKEDNTQ